MDGQSELLQVAACKREHAVHWLYTSANLQNASQAKVAGKIGRSFHHEANCSGDSARRGRC
jgi:hypothetical protein